MANEKIARGLGEAEGRIHELERFKAEIAKGRITVNRSSPN